MWKSGQEAQFGEGAGMHELLGHNYGVSVSADELDREASVISSPLRTREDLSLYRIFNQRLGFDIGQGIGRFVEV